MLWVERGQTLPCASEISPEDDITTTTRASTHPMVPPWGLMALKCAKTSHLPLQYKSRSKARPIPASRVLSFPAALDQHEYLGVLLWKKTTH